MPAAVNLSCAVLDEPIAALRRAGLDPQQTPALRESKRVWSYGKLQEEAGRAAAAFIALGLVPGDRLVLHMHDGVDLCAALLGALRAGLCVVPAPDSLRQKEVEGVLVDSGAAAVLCHADLVDSALPPQAPPLRAALCLGGSRPGLLDFAALCSQAEPPSEPRPAPPPAADPALLLYHTSPDGRPRARAFAHGALQDACDRLQALVGLCAEDRVFSAGRLSSGLGLLLGLLLPLRQGAVSFLLPDTSGGRGVGRGRAIFDVLGSFKPTIFSATPTIYNQLILEYLEMSAPRPAYFKVVRRALSFGEPLPRAVERRLRGVFQVEPLHGYCCDEALGPILGSGAGEGEARSGACGRPLPGVRLRVLAAEGQEAGSAEIGQLEIEAPRQAGLWCGVTQKVLPALPGWAALPDRFFIDEEGFFFHVGRSDGMFKVGGRLVAPLEVEGVLAGHPAVWECAVVEDEDEDGLLVPKAYVVLNVGLQPSAKLAQELMELVPRQLSPHKAPRAVEFVSQLPRGSDGRVQRWRLRSRPPQSSPPSAPLSPPSGVTPLRPKSGS